MSSGPRGRVPPLTVVTGVPSSDDAIRNSGGQTASSNSRCGLACPDRQTNMEDILDRHRLDAAIESLPHQQMQAIRLLKLKELSLKEAAVESKTPVAALKVATHRALRSLRKILSDWSGT